MKFTSYFLLFMVCFSCSENDDFDALGVTEEFIIESTLINDSYPINVFLPENYDHNSLNQLIIALDGDIRFNEIATIIADKAQNDSMPSSIFIAIGNNKQRNRDYTPTAYAHGSGGAESFYQFIKDELIPQLETRYKIDPSNNKTLIGHSFGGLFTQYVLAQDRNSNPFNKFIASGTSYWYDSGVIFEYEQTYADTHTDLDVRFYNGMGTLEGGVMLASFEEMNMRMDNRSFPNFKHKSELIEESGHSGSAKKTFKKGLDYVFSN
ncbi:alpha/beta hydrolase-fold protein [Zobellia galactanivorans]|uniref:Carbohydrate esterase, family CE1 n=1 Tax=Zobellia galactanivorans (strain DSM 12802 / CCUG 47099 / CIP 106680 / NCIMB 13871 / Dsij) TaxID=63186 RepID=G0L0H6_ZOBGA|nr:alpha/beta hydrolase-fold protein [Zobellia galactanivorans]MBU3026056.1 alpha/beta hydrolase [Zobellia galactanivorans]MDO6811027.1 alpha/beta hydrolase-fold protein [Zobellia galactanivorans]CAZ97407.1 Carbohydrate esterase, family CE1 [Zobellia galactanivorans]